MLRKVAWKDNLKNNYNMKNIITLLTLFCCFGCKYHGLKLEFDPSNKFIKVMDDTWVIYNISVSVEGNDVINFMLFTDSLGTKEVNLQSCNDDYDCNGNYNMLLNYEECIANVYIKKNGIPQYEQQVYRNFIFRFNPRDSNIQHIKIKYK